MSSKTAKMFSLMVAIAFMMTPFAFAADKMGQSTGHSSTMGTMGGQSEQGISATVESIDTQQGMITLRPTEGESIELKVPESMLSDLQTGDSVEVSIRKADTGQSSGQSGSSSSQPGHMKQQGESGSQSGSQSR